MSLNQSESMFIGGAVGRCIDIDPYCPGGLCDSFDPGLVTVITGASSGATGDVVAYDGGTGIFTVHQDVIVDYEVDEGIVEFGPGWAIEAWSVVPCP